MGKNSLYGIPPSPIVQLPQTPQYYPQGSHHQQQMPPQFAPPSPLMAHHQLAQQLPSGVVVVDGSVAAGSRRQQVARGLQYKDSAYESRRHSQTNGLNVDSFRLLSVLGRGHFGKVILSQYKNTG